MRQLLACSALALVGLATLVAQPIHPTQPEVGYGFLDTQLSPSEEEGYQEWKVQWAPDDSGWDYDLRGAWQAGLEPDPASGHWPDEFKKPNHPTFSVESRFAKDFPQLAGTWEGQVYVPHP